MPEILTKHPEITLIELKSAGAKCGVGVKQQILTSCPKENFCRLPAGEICVYGLNDISSMTQISVADFAEVTSSVPTIYSPWNTVLLAIACLFGLVFGRWIFK